MNKKVTSIVSYCTIIGWVIAYFAGDKDNAKFHLNQGLTLGIVGAGGEVIFGVIAGVLGLIARFVPIKIFSILIGLLGGFFGFLGGLVGIATLVLMVIGILNAVNDKEVALPVIGKFTFLK